MFISKIFHFYIYINSAEYIIYREFFARKDFVLDETFNFRIKKKKSINESWSQLTLLLKAIMFSWKSYLAIRWEMWNEVREICLEDWKKKRNKNKSMTSG